MLDCSPVSVHIVTPDRGRARAWVDVRDRALLHHDLHDLHRLRERGGGHRHGEDLHTLHDDRYGVWCVVMAPDHVPVCGSVESSVRGHLRSRDHHHPQHDAGHGQVPRDAGRGAGVHDPQRGPAQPHREGRGLRGLQVDQHQGQFELLTRASNKGSRRFHNYGEGPC